ncbi:hypothetical protein, partial [Brachybacterium sp.]|uniref:hypothetical protein n=1 Tax=Brachybacterium sp. TaxID=1891286 RepID=UPI003F97A066
MTALLLNTTARVRRRADHHRRCDCDRDTLETPWKAEMCQILHARKRLFPVRGDGERRVVGVE